MSKEFTAQELAERFIDQREVQNVMGKYVFTTMICRDADVVERFWSSKKADVSLGFNNGWYIGREAIDNYYRKVSENTMSRSRAIQKRFPEKLGEKNDEELYGAGSMNVRPLTTAIVEIASDSQTAKGLWQVMGVDNDITQYGPLSTWHWGYLAADFVLEDNAWRVWHMQMLDEIVTPVGTRWTEESPYEVLPEFEQLSALTLPEPTKTETLREVYRTDRPFTAPPRLPEPYDTFSETFSYGAA